ncbi:MAG: aminoacyl-tRNA hydrolase [Sphingobacteriales bacterium]|nr:aminoacyl-tRNA hydrolase [Sphingobacteriales bacterium]MBI3720688.1 aminoacyl-tRNA hydrolase [Sphingobacteriales bacterium]
MIDISREIQFQTARSGGKGGQNVNKVETMVIGFWNPDASLLFTEEEKQRLKEKLVHKINAEGYLVVKSQVHRSQLSNKEEVVRKMNELVKQALTKKKARIATATPKAIKEKRIENKKRKSEVKEGRKKIRF